MLAVPLPLLLVLDDLQWCDNETLECLHFLLRFNPHAPMLVVGTVRTGEIDTVHPQRALLRELRLADQLVESELAPLTLPETAQLTEHVASHSLAAEQLATISRVPEGIPLLVQEMIWAELRAGRALTAACGHESGSTVAEARQGPRSP